MRYRAVAICAGLLFPLNQRLQQVQLSNKLGRRSGIELHESLRRQDLFVEYNIISIAYCMNLKSSLR